MTESRPTTSIYLVFFRVFWMALGPAIGALLIVNIATHRKEWFTATDLIYVLVLSGLVFARWLEFRAGNPLTSTGEPAGPVHLQRYVIGTMSIGLIAWFVAKLMRPH